MNKAEYLFEIICNGIGDNKSDYKEFIKNFEQKACNFISNHNKTLLQEALSIHKKYLIGKFLIENECNLNHQDNNGSTALMYLLDNYSEENAIAFDDMIHLIIQKKVDINLVDEHGNQALWISLLNEKIPLEIIKLLLENGANPHHKNNYNKSVYDMVKEYNIDEITNIFLKK